MSWKLWLGRILACRLPPQGLVALAMKLWPEIWQKIPRDQRVIFFHSMAQEYLGALLGDMSREERASLMNALLPLVAREVPLAELDFLGVFASPGDRYSPQGLGEDRL